MISSPEVPSGKLHSTQEVWQVSFGLHDDVISKCTLWETAQHTRGMGSELWSAMSNHLQPERLTYSLSVFVGRLPSSNQCELISHCHETV